MPISTRAKKSTRIALIATGGGHLRELLALRQAYEGYDFFLIASPESRACPEVGQFPRQYFIWNTGAGTWKTRPWRFVRDFLQNVREFHRIFMLEQPRAVISTGSGIAVSGFLIAKILGLPTVFVESYARVQSLSLTGRLCYPFTDLFLVQHRGLMRKFRRAVYASSLYENLPDSYL